MLGSKFIVNVKVGLVLKLLALALITALDLRDQLFIGNSRTGELRFSLPG